MMFQRSCVADAVLRRRELDYKAAELRAQAWSISTWKTKASQWKSYVKFSASIMCTAVPTDSKMMCRYIVDLSSRLKYTTIQNYASGVISLNAYYGYDVKCIRSDIEFIMTMSGIRRVLGDPEPVRPSMSLSDLLRMFSAVDLSSPDQRCMWACIALSFRSLLRKCNLVPDSSSVPSGHYLRRSAVNFTSWGLEIRVSSSKTIQYGQRVHMVPVTLAQGSPLCAASLVKQHFAETPTVDPDSPAFLLKRKTGYVPLTYGLLLKFLKKLMSVAGLPGERAGMHSLRRAGALYMYRLGLTLEDIRQAGDWASMAALLYLTKPYADRIDTDRVVSMADCNTKLQ